MRLDELKEALSANVQDKREWLDKKADDIVAEMVSKEVPSRVNQQVKCGIINCTAGADQPTRS